MTAPCASLRPGWPPASSHPVTSRPGMPMTSSANCVVSQSRDGKTFDADSVRLVISVASSFFTFLERRDATIRNPFRGTKIRPRSDLARCHHTHPGGDRNTHRRGRPGACAPPWPWWRRPAFASGASLPFPSARKVATGPSPRPPSRGAHPLSQETRRVIRRARLDPREPFSTEALAHWVEMEGPSADLRGEPGESRAFR